MSVHPPDDEYGTESKQSEAADKIKQWFHKYSPKRPNVGTARPGHLKLRMNSLPIPVSCNIIAETAEGENGASPNSAKRNEQNGRSHRQVVDRGQANSTGNGSERKRSSPTEDGQYHEDFSVFK